MDTKGLLKLNKRQSKQEAIDNERTNTREVALMNNHRTLPVETTMPNRLRKKEQLMQMQIIRIEKTRTNTDDWEKEKKPMQGEYIEAMLRNGR